MYRVTIRQGWNGKEEIVHSAVSDKLRLIDPKITKSVDAIDTFQFSLNPKSPFYNSFVQWTTFVKVVNVRLDKVLFEGRVYMTNESMGSDGTTKKTVTCEGILAFLHDSTQDYFALSNNDLRAFLQQMINVHNRQVDSYKRVQLGNITVTSPSDNVYKSIDDSKSTDDSIQEKLIEKYGGEIALRNEPSGLYLDYMPEIAEVSNQEIRIAKNLVSITRAIDPTGMYSVIKPLGARIENEDESEEVNSEISQPRITIESVNNGDTLLYSQSLIDKIGYIVHAETWDDVNTPSILKDKGQAFLDNQKLIKESFQVSAVDLALLDKSSSIDSFEIGNYYHVYNPVLGIDESLRIVGLTLDIGDPLGSTLTIGDKMISQADSDKTIKKQADMINELNAKLASQAYKVNNFDGSMTSTNKYIKELEERVSVLENSSGNYLEGKIIDVSESQGNIDWQAVKDDGVVLAIIRVQYGGNYEDLTYKQNIAGAQAAGIRYAVYGYGLYANEAEAKEEAKLLFDRTNAASGSGVKPIFYAIDLEDDTPADGIQANTLAWNRSMIDLGVENKYQVAYIANHLYDQFNLDVSKFGSIWIPSYGSEPVHPYDLWQYTSTGSVAGISGNVDLSKNQSYRFKENYLKKEV